MTDATEKLMAAVDEYARWPMSTEQRPRHWAKLIAAFDEYAKHKVITEDANVGWHYVHGNELHLLEAKARVCDAYLSAAGDQAFGGYNLSGNPSHPELFAAVAALRALQETER